jgi:hypothetical protein
MNRASICALTGLLTVLSVGVQAAEHNRPARSVPAILTWISQHLNQSVPWDDSEGRHHTFQYSLEFNGCDVSLTRFMDGTTSSIYGPFNLKDVVPGEIAVSNPAKSNGGYYVSLGFLRLVPRHVAGPGQEQSAESYEVIFLPSQELAVRQQKAWHDAVKACGGMNVPDNLY